MASPAEGGHGCAALEEVSKAVGERQELISPNGTERAQGLAAGAGKGG